MKKNCFKGCFGPKEEVKKDVINKIIPEFISGSSTSVVYQQQAWKTLKRVQGLSNFIVALIGRVGQALPDNAPHKGHPAAFTLIELLVVVLIIGILAAVAVPQYQKAVARAHAVDAVTNLKAITDAQEVYYLAHGEYTNNLESLDVNVNADGTYFTYACKEKRTCKASPKNDGYPVLEFHMLHVSEYALPYAGKHWCMVERLVNQGASADVIQKARNICLSFGELDPEMPKGYHYLITH